MHDTAELDEAFDSSQGLWWWWQEQLRGCSAANGSSSSAILHAAQNAG